MHLSMWTYPWDIQDQGLETLAADPALRARLGAANAERARAHFDFAAMLCAYETAYARAMGRTF